MTQPAIDANKGLTLSFPICKVDVERGEVWGFATTEALDQQGEIVDYEASKTAFKDWADTFNRVSGGESLGNIREMHQPKVVGKMIAYQPDDERKGIYVGARVNRETADGKDAWNKVINHELNGFSIGAPTAERVIEITPLGQRKRVVGYKLAELSLVDNPACPESFFTEVKLAKRTGDAMAYRWDLIAPFTREAVMEKGGERWNPSTDSQRAWVSDKIKLLVNEGKPQDQAVAIAHTMAEERFSGTKESSMDAKGLAKQIDDLEKAGKKIGPTVRTAADPPGAQKPQVQHLEAPDAAPKPAKAAEAGGGVAGDDKGEDISVPKGQGKAADADANIPGGVIAPEHIDVPMQGAPGRKEGDADMGPTSMQPMVPNVPARYGYCAYCGSKQADAAGAMPYHKECEVGMKQAAAKQAAANELLKAGNLGGLAKLFRDQADALEKAHGVIASHANKIEALEKRVKSVEDSPTPGGPARTELPGGVSAVDKAAGFKDAGLAKEAVLETAMGLVGDPFVKDQLSRELAKSMIRRTQNGK